MSTTRRGVSDGSTRRSGASEQARTRDYRPDGDTLIDFMLSTAMVQIICGPIGSAKTITLLHKIHVLMATAHPSPDGKRRSRVAIVRNTYSDLETTTMAKWIEWWPEEEYGRIRRTKPMFLLWEQGEVLAEIYFLALDQADDVKKLKSLEPSIIVFNEVQFIGRDIFDEATSRVGRYPADVPKEKRHKFVLADMNAPEESHWTALALGLIEPGEEVSEVDRRMMIKPKGWDIFIQPPAVVELFERDGKTSRGFAVNPDAENLEYLGVEYYEHMLAGKSVEWVHNRLMVKVERVGGGAAVWPMFIPGEHIAKGPLEYNPSVELMVGLDFGRSPAAVIAQAYNGRIYVLSEVVRYGMSAERFAPILKRHLAQRYPGVKGISIWGDPSGVGRKGEASEITPFMIYRAHGLVVRKAIASPDNENDLEIRLDAVVRVLHDGATNGARRFIMDPNACPVLKAAMSGSYRYEQDKHDLDNKPRKDKFSHVADALQYLLIGMGEGRALLMGMARAMPVQTALHLRSAPRSATNVLPFRNLGARRRNRYG